MAKSKAAAPSKAQAAADLSAQLSNMMNNSAKGETPSAPAPAPEKKTASRSNFKGELIIPAPQGGVLSIIPIKTYVAVDEDKIERNMFHGRHVVTDGKGAVVMVDEIIGNMATGNKIPKTEICLGSLKQGAMACDACGTVVEKTAAQKGVRVGEKVVFISDEDLKAQQPMRDGKMKITEYVTEADINPIYYEDAEFVVPDTMKGSPVAAIFATLVEALKRTGKVAKGVRVKGGREQYFTLRPYGQHGMTMHYLRADYEVRNCNLWSPLPAPAAHVELSRLIEATSIDFTPAPQDRYLANVRRLIKQKAEGVEPEQPAQEAEAACGGDLIAELTAALSSVKSKQAKAGK
jgi:DNA end-binding protein Ku